MAHDGSAETPKKSFQLPVLVASPVDLGRLIRELETIDGAVLKTKLQKEAPSELPKTSHLMDQTIQLNKVDLADESHRKQLQEYLVLIKQKAPILHISFSADPTSAFIEKIMAWLRHEIHPLVLLTIGLQPNIGAGCVVRSTNKYFDFSLRKDFEKKRDLLLGTLGATEIAAARQPSAAVATVAPATQAADKPSTQPETATQGATA